MIVAAALLFLPACGERPPLMLGEHQVLVVAPDTLWLRIEGSLDSSLVARPVGLLPEGTFRLTHRSPDRTYLRELQSFRQIVVVGSAGDSLVNEALPQEELPSTLPALVHASDVWRAGQAVTVLALTEADGPATILDHVPELAATLDRHYRSWTGRRMYAGGVDSDLADSLASVGIELAVPRVYRWRRVSDSTFWFASQQNDLDRLVRSVLVTWRTREDEEPSVESVLDWRQAIADAHYEWGQVTQHEPLLVGPIDSPGAGGLEVRGVWSATVDGRPHGAPFITRMVDCPGRDRRYLLDAWLFAPNRGKYRYLIQLETLLDSFRCLDV